MIVSGKLVTVDFFKVALIKMSITGASKWQSSFDHASDLASQTKNTDRILKSSSDDGWKVGQSALLHGSLVLLGPTI